MLNRTIAKFLFYGVAVALLMWTASLTVSFIRLALPGSFWLVPVLGLVIFDVGMIAWLLVFLNHAEGAVQRAVAISLTVFDFAGVALMVMAEILLDGQQLVEAPAMLGTAAVWGIGIWTIVNVGGVIVFHLGDNEARKSMLIQAEKDALLEGALGVVKQRRIADQQLLADELGNVMYAELLSQIRAADTGNTGNNTGNYGRVTDPGLRAMIDDGRLPAQPAAQSAAPIPVIHANGKEEAPPKNGRGR